MSLILTFKCDDQSIINGNTYIYINDNEYLMDVSRIIKVKITLSGTSGESSHHFYLKSEIKVRNTDLNTFEFKTIVTDPHDATKLYVLPEIFTVNYPDNEELDLIFSLYKLVLIHYQEKGKEKLFWKCNMRWELYYHDLHDEPAILAKAQ